MAHFRCIIYPERISFLAHFHYSAAADLCLDFIYNDDSPTPLIISKMNIYTSLCNMLLRRHASLTII